MKKFKLLSLLLIICLFTGVLTVPARALDDPAVSSQCVVLMNADSGEIIYQKDADTAFSPGALTMLMSALVVGDSLERQDIRMDDMITQSADWRYNTGEGSRLAGYYDGDSLTVESLLYMSVMLSAEDTANALALLVSGSGDAFAAQMNSRAEELGCTGSHFVNAGGTYAEAQHTTSRDLALIAREVFQNEQVLSVFEAESATIPPTINYNKNWGISTDNALILSGSGGYYDFAYAGKTGTTSLGASLVSAATYNDIDVIAVVVGCPGDVFAETKSLYEWVFSNFGFHTLVSTTDVLDTLEVSMGNPGTVSVCASDSIQLMMANDVEPSEMSLDMVYAHEEAGTQLEAPIAVGEYLGDLTVSVSGQVVGTSRLVAATAVDISRLDYLHSQLDVLMQNQSVRKVVTILLGALGLYLLLVVVYTIQRLVHMHSLRAARKARAKTRAQQELEWLELPGSEQSVDYRLPGGGQAQPPEEFVQEQPAGEEPPAEAAGEEAPADGGNGEDQAEFTQEDNGEDQAEYVQEDNGEDQAEFTQEDNGEDQAEYVQEDSGEEYAEDQADYPEEGSGEEYAGDQAEYPEEGSGEEYAGDQAGYPEEDNGEEYAGDQADYPEEDGGEEYAGDQADYPEEDSGEEYAEAQADYPEEDGGEEYAEEEGYEEDDDDGVYEDEDNGPDDGVYEDEDDGPDDGPAPNKRRWWKR